VIIIYLQATGRPIVVVGWLLLWQQMRWRYDVNIA